ncbi:hypothetical protein TNCV_1635331 [Trichonephila clavipes]|nr:hypothetical protein TNCV_1635331 [Trichonephila clavipes]
MYKNALKEDFIRVVEKLNGTVENTDTIVKLKTKIENSSTFESDPDFVKTLIQNQQMREYRENEREVTLGKQKIELAKLQLAQFSSGLHGNTAADSVRSEWPLWHAAKSKAVFARRRSKSKPKQKNFWTLEQRERERKEERERCASRRYLLNIIVKLIYDILDAFTRGRIIRKLEEGRSDKCGCRVRIAHSIVSMTLGDNFKLQKQTIRGFSSGRPREPQSSHDRPLSYRPEDDAPVAVCTFNASPSKKVFSVVPGTPELEEEKTMNGGRVLYR